MTTQAGDFLCNRLCEMMLNCKAGGIMSNKNIAYSSNEQSSSIETEEGFFVNV
jgi:hypothetical protein